MQPFLGCMRPPAAATWLLRFQWRTFSASSVSSTLSSSYAWYPLDTACVCQWKSEKSTIWHKICVIRNWKSQVLATIFLARWWLPGLSDCQHKRWHSYYLEALKLMFINQETIIRHNCQFQRGKRFRNAIPQESRLYPRAWQLCNMRQMEAVEIKLQIILKKNPSVQSSPSYPKAKRGPAHSSQGAHHFAL